MKKVYLLVSGFLLAAGAVNAQVTTTLNQKAASNYATSFENKETRPGVVTDRAPGDVVWMNEFEDGTEWISEGPSIDADHGWSISGSTENWFFPAGDMGTTGDFAKFVNGDPNVPDHVEDGPWTLTFDGTIDLSGVPAPHLEFEQYGARFITLQAVEVSTDGGTTWTQVGNNDDLDPLTLGGGSQYDQPETRRFNITTAVAGDPSNVSIRLFWDGALNGPALNYVEYAWFVDNIRIVEGFAFDSDIQSAFFKTDAAGAFFARGLTYYQVPTEFTREIQFSAETINQGGSTFTGLALEVEVEQGGSSVYTGSSDATDVFAGAADSATTTTNFTPSAIGTYDITWVFEGDDPDGFSDNDVIEASFDVTEFTYGRDNGVQTGGISNFATNGGLPFVIGNGQEIPVDAVIGAIDVELTATATNEGQLMYAALYLWDEGAGDFIYIDQTPDYMVTAGDLGSTVKLFFDDAIEVNAGQLVIIAAGHYGDAGGDLNFASAQPVEAGVWGYDAAGARFGLANPNAVMVRADIRDFASLEDEVISNFKIGQNQPNPFGDNTVINYELNEAANVSVEFVDISGKVVRSINNGTQSAGAYTINVDGTDFAEGVYFYTFTIGADKVTKRMVVNK